MKWRAYVSELRLAALLGRRNRVIRTELMPCNVTDPTRARNVSKKARPPDRIWVSIRRGPPCRPSEGPLLRALV